MQVGVWQCWMFGIQCGDFCQGWGEQGVGLFWQLWGEVGILFQYLGQVMVVWVFEDVFVGGGVKVVEQIVYFLVVVGVWLLFVVVGQVWLQQCWFVFEMVQGFVVVGVQGVGYWQVVFVEYVEQFDEEWQVLYWVVFDQGQDEFVVFQVDEEVVVFGVFGDVMEILQVVQVVGGEEGFQG